VIAALALLPFAARYPTRSATPARAAPPGASLCFAATSPLDLVDSAGRKVLGSAQRRTGNRVLHQGCLPLRPAASTPAAAALLRSRADVEPLLVTAIAAALGLAPYSGSLTPEEDAQAARLAALRRIDPHFPPPLPAASSSAAPHSQRLGPAL
jgi:lipoate-protein ligase A